MWPILEEVNDKFNVGCTFTESNLTMTHPNGSRLQLFGADMQNFIRRLKGIKTPGVAIDEAQDFGSHLRALVDDVLTPCLTDYEDSWLAITGTPGPVPLGYFYEITYCRLQGFSFHNWTLYENRYLPNAQDFVSQLKIKRSWDETHPTLRREWYNEWDLDKESLLVKYEAHLNDYVTLPHESLIYILGIDIGFHDFQMRLQYLDGRNAVLLSFLWKNVSYRHRISLVLLKEKSIECKKTLRYLQNGHRYGGLGKKIAERTYQASSNPCSGCG